MNMSLVDYEYVIARSRPSLARGVSLAIWHAWAGAATLNSSGLICECATRRLVPTRGPVLFLTRIAAVPGGLALRANLEVFEMAHDLAPFVLAILISLNRHSTKLVEFCHPVDWIMPPLPQPIQHVGQDILRDVVTLHDPSRRGHTGGLPNMSNLAAVG